MIAEVVSLPGYESQVSALLSEQERMRLEFFIACAPEDHPIIPGTGGFRKARFARPQEGKSGGYRVIYFFRSEQGTVYMAAIFAKSRKENLTEADKTSLAKLAAQIKRSSKGAH